ncbi:hypothetical protein ATANTOWER_007802 [Ataeniobius toweri]|uniref:Uncharacterized protein n=1 Tax=Ataeniobius toweri TaxID=208326 RepID=A0ABU7BEX7_9TELE|nr:hypothetical protein [Ataeniobius toweri]
MSTPQMSFKTFPRPEYAQIESAARNMLPLLTATVQNPGQNQQAQLEIQGPSPSQELRLREANVQQEMTKCFPVFSEEKGSVENGDFLHHSKIVHQSPQRPQISMFFYFQDP